jgi:SAM-dependent methyltransferase
LQALSGAVETFQASASAHLANLTEHLGGVAAETRTMVQRLYAAPYVSDPVALHTKDAVGRDILGYDAGSGASAAVYRGFEDVFRGDERLIRDRFRCYLPLLRERGSVLDVGCGRGEMLELLRDAQIPAHGVDLDAGMVERCRAKGLEATHADAIEHLATLPDGSVGAIFASQLIEHLPYEALNAFLRIAHAKLAGGGLLIAETVNPHSIEAFKTFWTDLTHEAPIFPEVALTLCRLHGFSRAQVRFGRPTGDLDEERRLSGDYAVIATR